MTGWLETGCPLKAFQNTRVVASAHCCILTEFLYVRPCPSDLNPRSNKQANKVFFEM